LRRCLLDRRRQLRREEVEEYRQLFPLRIRIRQQHDKALQRVMTALLKDDTELFKQFVDNESFRRWLTDTVFGMTYDAPVGTPAVAP
jgi:hypothetical protein